MNFTHKLVTFLDRVSFPHIFLAWISLILFFGIIYTLGGPALIDVEEVTFTDAVHYSIVAANTATFGTANPIGFGKILATIEIILNLLVYGLVISKLVSFKQEIILEEIYNISFDERINRLRSMLYLFRADLNRVIERINEGRKASELRLKESTVYFHSLHHTLQDIEKILSGKNHNSHYVKKVDFFTFELLLNSIIISLDKVCEFFQSLNTNKVTVEKHPFHKPLKETINITTNMVHKYKEIDDEKLIKKLYMLETLNKRIESHLLEE